MRTLKLIAPLLAACSLNGCATPGAVAPRLLDISEQRDPFVIVAESRVAILGVTVIDGTGRPARADQAVLLENGRIAWVGDSANAPLSDHLRIDGTGRTLIPGIVGMHDHLHRPGVSYTGYSSTRLWLAGGVTAVQTAGAAETERELSLARAIAEEGELGPEIFTSAPYVTGSDGNGPMAKPATTAEARAFVRYWAGRGVTWFKLYRHTEPGIAAAIIAEAHRLGLKTTGHLCSISFAAAAAMGIDRIEHGLNAAADFVVDRSEGECRSNRDALDKLALDDPRLLSLIDTLVSAGVTITSTLPIIESGYPVRFHATERSLLAMNEELRAQAQARRLAGLEADEDERERTRRYDKIAAFELLFAQRGGKLVAGPDPGRHVLPGFGNQRAAILLHEAGFGVSETIRILTANGADELEAGDRFGRIAVGLEADLVLLDGDLNADIESIARPRIVFSDGIGYDPERLLKSVKGQVGIR